MSRIEDLERRLAKDPSSKIFAQLAEEYRKAGRLEEAIETCREGLKSHPNYFSARVALARALLESGILEEAGEEFEAVLSQVPDNILANKFLADTYHQMGRTEDALAKFRVAQILAPSDAEIASRVRELEAEVRETGGKVRPEVIIEETPSVQDFDRYELEPTLVETDAPASLTPEPEGERVFEFQEEEEAAPAETERKPSTLVRRHASELGATEPVSEEARAIQDEIERGFPTGVVKRQAREIRDSEGAPPLPPLPEISGAPPEPPFVSPEPEMGAPGVSEPSVEPAWVEAPPPPPPIPAAEPPRRESSERKPESVRTPPGPARPAGKPAGAQTSMPTVTLGELYASQGHLEQALSVFRELLTVHPEDPQIRQRVEDLTMLVHAESEVPPPERMEAAQVDEDTRAIDEAIRRLEGWLAAIRES